jgi:DNA-binding HxlR family transcriptional regulator
MSTNLFILAYYLIPVNKRLLVTLKLVTTMEKSCEGPNFTSEDCSALLMAVGDALYAIGGKWKLRVIIGLSGGNKRFNELRRIIPAISARVLSNELKELEMNGFVKRNVYAKVSPVIVEYELTEYSSSLKDVVGSLSQWGIMHRERIKQNTYKI